MFEVCGHLLSQFLSLRLSSPIALLWGIVSVYGTRNFDMLAPDFQLTLQFLSRLGGIILIIWICFVSSVDMFAVSAFLNFVSVSNSTS